MDDALRARLLRHIECHAAIAHHSDEQAQWAEDLRDLLAEVERLRADQGVSGR